jgi:hypothetical protein
LNSAAFLKSRLFPTATTTVSLEAELNAKDMAIYRWSYLIARWSELSPPPTLSKQMC